MRPTKSAVPATALLGFVLAPMLSPHLGAQDQGAGTETGLPEPMIFVEGGKMTLGIEAKELEEVGKQLHPRSSRRLVETVQKLASELGEVKVEVDSFYLHRTPVTNEQYLQYVQSAPVKVRFPYHWWRFGEEEDWRSRQSEARKAFPNENKPDLLYWEKYYDKLPYSIPKGQEQYPVVFVSWVDAQKFAGWAGMRLPTEAEWIWAASKGERKQYLWGDEWSEDLLKKLDLYGSRDRMLKPVGAVGEFTTGPFGHQDMVGQVWEWVADIGFFPLGEQDDFQKEFKRLQRSKVFADITLPEWNGAQRVVKGSSFFSYADPSEFRLGTRASLASFQTLEGVGFRLAKDKIPARDMCRSRLTVEYDASFFGGDKAPNISDQVGVERYHLADEGKLITAYDAVAIVPLNQLGLEKTSLSSAQESSLERPLVVGTLVTTEPMSQPELAPGIYTVFYRAKGMSKELEEALRDGSRALMLAKKTGGEVEEGEWRQVLSRYGITEEEATVQNAHASIDFMRLKPGGLKIPLDENLLVFRANQELQASDYVAFVETDAPSVTSKDDPAEMKRSTSKDHKEQFTFTMRVPMTDKRNSKRLEFELPVVLSDAADVSKPWRMPNEDAAK